MKKSKKGHEVTHVYTGGEEPFRFGLAFSLVVWCGYSFFSWLLIGIEERSGKKMYLDVVGIQNDYVFQRR
jgi:hypothetical protein